MIITIMTVMAIISISIIMCQDLPVMPRCHVVVPYVTTVA